MGADAKAGSRPDRFVVGPAREIPPGERRIVDVGGISIGVFNVAGTFYALLNRCPHQAGPLCAGTVLSTLEADAPGVYRYDPSEPMIECPWHGWEFSLATGQSYFDPAGTRVRAYPVTRELGPYRAETVPVSIEEDLVVLTLRRG